eukprot:scaffold10124_cov57-Phaeocystis_antarctica.AAC.5
MRGACDCVTCAWHVHGMCAWHKTVWHVHGMCTRDLVGEYVVVVLAAVDRSPLLPPARVARWLRRPRMPLDRRLVHTEVGRGRGIRPRCWAKGCGMHRRGSSAWWYR